MKLLLSTLFVILPALAKANDTSFLLAKELMAEQSHELSAIEFRRFAMESDSEADRSAAYLYAGYAYVMAKQFQTAGEMIDRSEAADTDSTYTAERALLNAENARLARDADVALYYYDLLSVDAKDEGMQVLAHRRAAALHLANGDFTQARTQLSASPGDEAKGLQALEKYELGKDKSPGIGGLLGMIPGAGYWYSGEIANGLRSLILNSLFMYGMYQTADDEQWGGFAVITFFEITWYSGSIYGGIDAAQRYNKDRLDTAIDAINGPLSYEPDLETTVPMFKLNILF